MIHYWDHAIGVGGMKRIDRVRNQGVPDVAVQEDFGEPVAGGGLLHRRAFLRGGVAFAGATGALAVTARDARSAADIAQGTPITMHTPGAPLSKYGVPSSHERQVVRAFTPNDRRPGTGASRTPLQMLNGTITPNGLHFERHHNGIPDTNPNTHQLLIHGLVERPLFFGLEDLHRYPMETHIRFIECSGNSGGQRGEEVSQRTAGELHGLVSCSEWTGVRLAVLLEEAGVDPSAKWILAEGADAAGMSRSVPLEKCWEDAVIALYQNGEAIRPEQGHPMRLLLPGYEGNMSVKWLHRIEVTETATYTKDETSKYSDLLPSGKSLLFTFTQGVKSVITQPSQGHKLPGAGTYQITGLAWSGAGRVREVEVSADGGTSWAEAALDGPVLPMALTRFRLPWAWTGDRLSIQSRATDDAGNVQPTRDEWLSLYGPSQFYHYNAIQLWGVNSGGDVWNIHYA
jgi:sulfane dehydrogenase subunit SoxC